MGARKMAFENTPIEQDPHISPVEEFPFDWLDLPVVFVSVED